MELQFKSISFACLEPVLQQVQASEQTQEIRLSDGMPDAGRVISAWGQCVVRSKEWHSSYLSFSGGMMVWVLYESEDGSSRQVISSWIPFQMRWELPEDTPDGHIRVLCLPKAVDARSVSPRKLMIRAGMSVLAEAWVKNNVELQQPGEDVPGVELLRNRYPVRVRKAAGEKTFQLDEELRLPESAPGIQKIVYCTLEPQLTDSRVVADKLVFRGNGMLHLLYQSETGQLHTWDFPVPFSHYAELSNFYDGDALGDIRFAVTGLETESDDNGLLRLKAGLVAQYVISDREMLELAEDGYSLGWELERNEEEVEVPVQLDNRRENLYAEQTLPAEANLVVDARFHPDFPKQGKTEQGERMDFRGTFQTLFYGADGTLSSGNSRWEEEKLLPAGEESHMLAIPQPSQPQAMAGNGEILLKTELPVDLLASALQRFTMLTSVKTAQEHKPDPGRPSLILRRAGGAGLWQIARESGSTVRAIRQANGLQEEPAPDKLLLIPVL